jgi:ABC-2 type transport system permease protein
VALSGWAVKIVLVAALLPAILLAFMLSLWGLLERNSDAITAFLPFLGFLDPEILAGPRPYRVQIWTLSYSIFLGVELYFAMFLILLVGPGLISQDLRYNALPMYFSRPLRRIDYLAGKLGIIFAMLGVVIIAPSILAYLLGLMFSLDVTILRDTFRVIFAAVVYGLIIAVSAGMLILALSSLSRNSRYVALMWVGVWVVTGAVSGVLTLVNEEEREQIQYRINRGETDVTLDSLREADQRDWRPLVSYHANLSRVGQQLLGTDAAWEKLSQLRPGAQQEDFLRSVRGPQFPWYWSAAVLLALLGLSACILNYRIKSLDQLG